MFNCYSNDPKEHLKIMQDKASLEALSFLFKAMNPEVEFYDNEAALAHVKSQWVAVATLSNLILRRR